MEKYCNDFVIFFGVFRRGLERNFRGLGSAHGDLPAAGDGGPGGGAGAGNIAAVLGDFRFHQYNIQHIIHLTQYSRLPYYCMLKFP